MVTGGQPVPRSDRRSAPRPLRATSRSATGRCRIRGRAVEVKRPVRRGQHRRQKPEARARIGHVERGRRATGSLPRSPRTGSMAELASCSTSMPSVRERLDHDLRILAVERAGRTLGPSASAATTSARLVRLFEPGTRTTARGGGPFQGSISSRSG